MLAGLKKIKLDPFSRYTKELIPKGPKFKCMYETIKVLGKKQKRCPQVGKAFPKAIKVQIHTCAKSACKYTTSKVKDKWQSGGKTALT